MAANAELLPGQQNVRTETAAPARTHEMRIRLLSWLNRVLTGGPQANTSGISDEHDRWQQGQKGRTGL